MGETHITVIQIRLLRTSHLQLNYLDAFLNCKTVSDDFMRFSANSVGVRVLDILQ